MKFIWISIITFLSLPASAQNEGFTINGVLRGNADGMNVTLQMIKNTGIVPLDSAIIKNGKFLLKGALTGEERVRLQFDTPPSNGVDNKEESRIADFFINNAAISFSANVDSLQDYYYSKESSQLQPPVILGSQAQEIYMLRKNATADLEKEYGRLYESYLNEFHIPSGRGVFHTARGVELVKKMREAEQKIDEEDRNFIQEHPTSAATYDAIFSKIMMREGAVNSKTLDFYAGIISKGWGETEKGAELLQMINGLRRQAAGMPYLDFALQTTDRKKVNLSQYVKKGRYNLLEFWASWCGPCRGEIPHLKHLKKEYGDHFNIVGISFDDNAADWKKALRAEKMPWVQLVDFRNFEGEYAKAYHIGGIPFSIILDPEGKIVETNIRGAQIDYLLQQQGVPKASKKTAPPAVKKKPVKKKK